MKKTSKRLIQLFVAAALLAAGVVGMGALTASKPKLEKREQVISHPLVKTVEVELKQVSVMIEGEGTVRPLQEISLVPQVGGNVVGVSPSLVNGGRFSKDDVLLSIDPADYKVAVTLARAKVKDSESKVKLAKEEAAIAREEWRIHRRRSEGKNSPPPPLVAKEPQLAAARALLQADRATLSKALLNLERTELKAPFDGRVSMKNVDVGQYVVPGQAVAAIYSIEAAEIVLPLENDDLFWFEAPGFTPGSGAGAMASVKARVAGREMSWPGRVVRTQGKLDEKTRLVNVVVRVEGPYERKPPLAAGLFVRVEITGRTLEKAADIPRAALRAGNTVWIVDNNSRLRFREVEVARVYEESVLILAGLKEGERIVTSSLRAVSNGMLVRTPLTKAEDES